MLPWSSNNKCPRKHATTNDSDLSKIVAVATNKIQSNVTPMASSGASAPSSLRPYEMRKNYQQKPKTSAEIISETKSMLANGEFDWELICVFICVSKRDILKRMRHPLRAPISSLLKEWSMTTDDCVMIMCTTANYNILSIISFSGWMRKNVFIIISSGGGGGGCGSGIGDSFYFLFQHLLSRSLQNTLNLTIHFGINFPWGELMSSLSRLLSHISLSAST